MSVTLSRELRTKHSVRALPVRKDDEVVILKGKILIFNRGYFS
jgi:ribosomal protein uL24